MKFRYDNKHKSLMFKVDDMIYLRFHKSYSLSSKFIKKLNNQYVESFFVKRRINRLIYELNLFFISRVYLVISITQLKSIDVFVDSYQRFKFDYSKFVDIDQQNENENSRYEMKKIVNRRLRIFDKTKMWQYLIRWKNWESKNDHWKFEFACDDCQNLIKKYELRHFKFKTRKFFDINTTNKLASTRRFKMIKKIFTNTSNTSSIISKTIVVIVFATNASSSTRRRNRFKKTRE